MKFAEFFKTATGGNSPYPYQKAIAEGDSIPELLSVPTGVGKTAAAILGWLWRRKFGSSEKVRSETPRRLVYCLPMRTLVEQTARESQRWLENLRMNESVSVHLLMGGENVRDWAADPTSDAILIGTQDMLISRALNRGYGAKRHRWALELGLLLNDAMWVFDEVQLMGNGLVTSVQLDAFKSQLWPSLLPCKFIWMSATLGPDILQTRDREDWGLTTTTSRSLTDADRKNPEVDRRLNAAKRILFTNKLAKPKAADILAEHRLKCKDGGRISLVVMNTVPAAKAFHEELIAELTPRATKAKKKAPAQPTIIRPPEVVLLHGRFRKMDRDEQMRNLIGFMKQIDRRTGAVATHPGLIIVSTQVIEAGFDLSAVSLWSEIAPWASLIQRLGRLNREGLQPNATATFWLPKANDQNKGEGSPNAKRIGPYDKGTIDLGQKLIEGVEVFQAQGLKYRDALDTVSALPESVAALKITADVVIRPPDFFELYSTEPDLAGGFTNVASYVRSNDRDVDAQVFWRDFDANKGPDPTQSGPTREELVAVPFFELRTFFGKTGIAFEWNFETNVWERRRSADVWPGMTLMLPHSAGGYQKDSGWSGNSTDRDFDVLRGKDNPGDSFDADRWSGFHGWLPLDQHLRDVEAEVRELCDMLKLDGKFRHALGTAARWHDWGKSVSRWQNAVGAYIGKAKERLIAIQDDPTLAAFHDVAKEWLSMMNEHDVKSGQWAKFPDPRGAVCDTRMSSLTAVQQYQFFRLVTTQFRPNLRHEAASALAAWQFWRDGDPELSGLIVYLIASHHGKVRTVLRSRTRHDQVFGLSEGDTLAPIPGVIDREVILNSDCRNVGATGVWNDDRSEFTIGSPSWIQMIAELLGPCPGGPPVPQEALPAKEPRELGPISLAYLEAILIAADVKASRTPGKGAKV